MAIVDPDLLLGDSSVSIKLQAMQEAAALAESDLPGCTFDWNGILEIPCVGGPQYKGKVLDIGGWKSVRRVKIKVRQISIRNRGSDTFPDENHIITYRGASEATPVRYRVVGVKNWFDVLMELECEDANQ